MLKKFCAFVCAFAFTASFAWAQDEASSESTEESTEVYYPQSEVVSVLNATDENGNYVAEWDGDNVVLRFKFTYPWEKVDTMFYLGLAAPTYSSKSALWEGANGVRYVNLKPYGKNNTQYFYTFSKLFMHGKDKSSTLKTEASFEYIPYRSDEQEIESGSKEKVGYCILTVTLEPDEKHREVFFVGDTIKWGIGNVSVLDVSAGEYLVYREYSSAEYTFLIQGDEKHVAVDKNTNSSELNIADDVNVYIKSQSILNVNSDFNCKEIFIQPADEENGGLAGGLVINEGASLVADSVYFCANKVDDRSLPYLVNNGSYSAGSVFSKDLTNQVALADNYAKKYGLLHSDGYADDGWFYHIVSFSNPFESESVSGWIDMLYRTKWTNTLKASGVLTPYIDKANYLTAYYTWESLVGVESSQPLYLFNGYLDLTVSLRLAGSINNEEKYELAIEDVNPQGVYDDGQAKTFINNPYQAPIDWRSISETAGDQFVNDVKDVHLSFVMPSLYSMYNLKTGFTTFDAPGKMYYGYLQPQISNAQLVHQNGNQSVVTISKSDVCSYAMADEKYGKSDIVDYPYIRLYVDETDEAVQKGEGLRSVVVLYFVTEDKYDELHNSETASDYDANYGINTVWETLAETCYNGEFMGGGYIFPYLGAYEPGQTKSDKATVIKMVKIPTGVSKQYKGYGNSLSDFIRVSIDKDMTEGAVKLGVLDYNLGDSELGICLGDIALNYPGKEDNLSMSINVKDGYVESEPSSLVSTNRSFEADKVYDRWDCKQLSLNLNIAQVDRTADKKIATPDASAIKSANGRIYVNSSVSGTLSVYDLAGRLIIEKSAEGSVSVSVPNGVYVAAYSSANSTVRSRVAVK